MMIIAPITAIARKHPRKTALLLLTVVVISLAFLRYSTSAVNPRLGTKTIVISKGAGFVEITKLLHDAGLTGNRPFFWTLALSKRATQHIRAGEYELAGSMSPAQIIEKLVRGDIKFYQVTLPEDITVREVATRLAEFKLIDEKEFMALAKDRDFLASLGIEEDSIEGYLYPNTYHLDRSMNTREVMRILVRQFWKEITPEMRQRAEQMGLTLNEWLTLASIIGKESGNSEEKTLISAVFHNRLKLGMKLQSDPTAVYRVEQKGNLVKTVLRRHLAADTPYNTYRIMGLPPGPIANPGIDSLRAALYPARAGYLYFVAKNDGTHQFSTTLEMHNRATSKYQINRQKK
jgi:UPF0755 protein